MNRHFAMVLIFSAFVRLSAEPSGVELLGPGLQPRVEDIPARMVEHADPARGPVWSVAVSQASATDWAVRLVATNAVGLVRGERAVVEFDLRQAGQNENGRGRMVDGRWLMENGGNPLAPDSADEGLVDCRVMLERRDTGAFEKALDTSVRAGPEWARQRIGFVADFELARPCTLWPDKPKHPLQAGTSAVGAPASAGSASLCFDLPTPPSFPPHSHCKSASRPYS